MTSAKVLGLLPARSGSKGIPGKNLRPISGKPLLTWAAEALSASRSPSRRVCSTDDEAIAAVAEKCGLEVPWMRPSSLGEDSTLVVDVITHALRSLDEDFTHVALVQATSPGVTPEDIDRAVRMAVDKEADTVISGFLAGQRHPSTMYTLDDGVVEWLFGAKQRMARRQDLPEVFIRTGLIYVMRSDLVLEQQTIYGDRVCALTVPEDRAVTIDEEADFVRAQYLLCRETG